MKRLIFLIIKLHPQEANALKIKADKLGISISQLCKLAIHGLASKLNRRS